MKEKRVKYTKSRKSTVPEWMQIKSKKDKRVKFKEQSKPKKKKPNIRDYNIGTSNYAEHNIQPWDIWIDWKLNPFDADIIKRTLRDKKGNDRKMDYEKIIHICQERIRQLDEGIEL